MHEPLLKSHLDNPQLKSATYISPDVQNQIASVIGKQKDIVREIVNARYCSIMVDEVTSHNVEWRPLCIRFVDSECNIGKSLCSFQG